MAGSDLRKLKRELSLRDVYAISTGAMFSSGFFLLPGIAFAQAGAWIILAYAASALLVVPAMLSQAELATAMPRAGGAYFFLDRSLGPLAGTVGGLGTWIAMGLKNTFALIGMGAYIGLVLDVDITWVALVLTVVFCAINIAGAKETAALQRVLVFALVGILAVFVLGGLVDVAASGFAETTRERLAASPPADLDGVLATIGLVFVSYAGLTKVAGVAEEVEHPERNILRGMALSLFTALIVYTLGAYVLVMVLEPQGFAQDLTPIATAGQEIFSATPTTALYVILIAAIAAFASTANAGILAASRYLLAMGRDRLIPDSFGRLGRLGTPTLAVLVTGAFIALALLTLDVVSVAKLASAFQLLMFALINLAVIVMRESRLGGYDPPYRSPFYPWTQIIGIFASLGLIVEMGRLPILFTMALVAVSVAWFFSYARRRVVRRGAVLHWFERLGRDRFEALDFELREIVLERGLHDPDDLDRVIGDAPLIDLDGLRSFEEVAWLVARELEARLPIPPADLRRQLVHVHRAGFTPVVHGAALPHCRVAGLASPLLVLVRSAAGVELGVKGEHPGGAPPPAAHALFFLVSPEEDPAEHLRMLARLASLIERPDFLRIWTTMESGEALRSALAGDAEVWELARALLVARGSHAKAEDP